MHTHIKRILSASFLVVLLAAAIVSGIAVSKRVGYEFAGPFNGDSTIYWAVGRGIVNGLIPYRDLFETKPPGIFLISSFSFWLTGDVRMASVLQALVFLLLPLTLMLCIARIHRSRPWKHRAMLMLFGLCFGSILTLYSGERSGEFQVESFGALAVTLYAVVLAWDPQPLGRVRIALASLFLFCAVGLKEPFALTALATALLLAHHPKDLLRSFVYPALIVAVAGIALMSVLDYLQPYLHIYLPEMLGKHIHGTGPLWQRGLQFNVVLHDVSAYSPVLMQLIVSLVIATTFIRLHSHHGLRGALFITTSQTMAAYLLVLAVGVGGAYWNHHFVFAVPGYIALFLLFVRETHKHWLRFSTRFAVVSLALLTAITTLEQPTIDYSGRLTNARATEAMTREQAALIDATLDACGIDRYLFLGANGSQPFAFTKHFPIGPLFLQYDYWFTDSRPQFQADMLRAVEQSFFVVVDHIHLLGLTDVVQQHLNEHFVAQPWECARDIGTSTRYRFLYRKSEAMVH